MHSVHCCAGGFTLLRHRPRKWVAWVHEHRVVFCCLFLVGLLLAMISQPLAGPSDHNWRPIARIRHPPHTLMLSAPGAFCRSAIAKSVRVSDNRRARLFFVAADNPV